MTITPGTPLEINLSGGADQSIDPRIAPQGTIYRAQNVRSDKDGRLVLRSGYTALGRLVQGNTGSNPMVPLDLYSADGRLFALGRHGVNQKGAHWLYEYVPSAAGDWRHRFNPTDANDGSGEPENGVPYSLAPRIVLASLATASATEEYVSDVALSSSGFVCHVVSAPQGGGFELYITILDSTGREVYGLRRRSAPLGVDAAENPRVVACGDTFIILAQRSTDIVASTFTVGVSTTVSAETTIVSGVVSVIPTPYAASSVVGSTTDFLLAWPTGAGYTWRRFNSSLVQQTTQSVASIANPPVDICGSVSSGSVFVLNKKTGTGAEVRQFNLTTAALTLGPTTVDPTVDTIDAVFINFDTQVALSTVVCCVQKLSGIYSGGAQTRNVTNLGLNTSSVWNNQRMMTRPAQTGGVSLGLFHCQITGPVDTQYVVMRSACQAGSQATTASRERVHASLAHGNVANAATPTVNQVLPAAFVSDGADTQYASLVIRDPRGDTVRAMCVRFAAGSDSRRQGAVVNGCLYLSGGQTQLMSGDTVYPASFLGAPVCTLAQSAGGSMTALGVYQYVFVLRIVYRDGRVMQSAPSDVQSITLTGINQTVVVSLVNPADGSMSPLLTIAGSIAYLDTYRTEAGGSIPRLIQSARLIQSSIYGVSVATFVDSTSDVAQQQGAPVYTQGGDGVVSGRLPYGPSYPARFIVESMGRLLTAGLESVNELQISHENRPGEAVAWSNDDLFFLTGAEEITGLASIGQRRIVFTDRRVYEVLGEGPNMSGIGEMTDPIVVDPSVGCVDWRSICETELGVFFQPSNTTNPSIYLLPGAGGTAIDVGRGVQDILADYPIVVAATRNEEQQLVSFILQNASGTDSRLVHLDIRASGLGSRGWQGRWFADRIALLEAEQAPYIVSEQEYIYRSFAIGSTFTIALPEGRKLNDRVVIIIGSQGPNSNAITNFTLTVNAFTSGGTTSIIRVYERRLTSASAVFASSASLGFSSGTVGSVTVRVLLIRGSDPAQALQHVTAAVTGTAPATGALAPSWGAANNLWLSLAYSDASFTPSLTSGSVTMWRIPPATYEGVAYSTVVGPGAGQDTSELATAWTRKRATSENVTWGAASSTTNAVSLLAFKPVAATTAIARACVTHNQRLYLATSDTVYHADPTATTDQGGVQVDGYLELGTIYAMGAGGAARHTGITFVGELLGFCALTAWCSYDDGYTWQPCRTHHLSPALGFTLGQTVRLHWTPKRRKVDGVRVRFEVTSEDGFSNPATGTTRGVAMMKAILWFEGLVGKSRAGLTRNL